MSPEQQKIDEGNDIIAEFLGWFKEGAEGTWYVNTDFAKYVAYSIHNNYPHRDLPFHRDWNALMPVLEKIEAMDYDSSIIGKVVMITKDLLNGTENEVFLVGQTKREAVWLACVEIIKKIKH